MRKPTHKEPGGSQRGGNEAQEGPKGGAMRSKKVSDRNQRGRRVTNGAGRVPTVSRRTPKGSKRGARGSQGGGGGPWRIRRVAKGTWIDEFVDCYTVS